MGVFVFFYQKRKRSKKEKIIGGTKIQAKILPSNDLDNSDQSKTKYHIVFFGGFQVLNKNFDDITSYFSPLLKELFLLIFLYSFKNNKGISSEKLTEILWYDKSDKSARNNRAVNIAKLKGFLEEIGSCELSKKTGYWKIGFEDSQIYSDYFDFLNITSSKKNLTKQKIIQLIEITQKGGFLINAHYEWLDEFKALVSDKIMDTLVEYGQTADIKAEADFVVHLADCIFNFDLVNEEAMMLKCKAQYCMGKHSHAKATYEKFFKEYNSMYNQEYDKAFTDIINSKDIT
jgi:DNA-binding SARP family transcriptional activator